MSDRRIIERYDTVAILLHWFMAVLLIGMLAMGKFIGSLGENEPLTFTLIQWHKTFGVLILGLIGLRVLWRLTHRPPPAPEALPAWQVHASEGVHGLLYGLMLAIPLSGWAMVSASPLGVPTLLFDRFEWPHLPAVLPDQTLADNLSGVHELLANLMILALLLHIGAALKHRLIDRDGVLARMQPSWAIGGVLAALLLSLAALSAWSAGTASHSTPVDTDVQVGFVAQVMGADIDGAFADASVQASLPAAGDDGGFLNARVATAVLSSDNAQVASSLPDADWFDASTYPEATFESDTVDRVAEDRYDISGSLTLRGHSQRVQFPLVVESGADGNQTASGTFTVDRREFGIGMISQPDGDTVGYEVRIQFRFVL